MTGLKPCVFAICTVLTVTGSAIAGDGGTDQGAASPSAATTRRLAITAQTDVAGIRAKEPMIVEHPDGTLFVAGFGQPPGVKLWKSKDHGATWARVNVGTAADGALGNSDTDLAVARDGTLYFTSLEFNNQTGEGVGVSIGVSKDGGETWRWKRLSEHRFDDRPWVAVASDGTAHVIWDDGQGVNYAVSRDGGVTWTQQPRISNQGGASHLAVGPKGEVAVRIIPPSSAHNMFHAGVDLIAVSRDGGARWSIHPAPGHREWGSGKRRSPQAPALPPDPSAAVRRRWVEPLAWDGDGTLYFFWADGKELWLARSADFGETWKSAMIGSGEQIAYFPYLVAQGTGDLAATWFSGEGDMMLAHMAHIDASGKTTAPLMIEAPPFLPELWGPASKPDDPPFRVASAGGEYLAITFLKSGGFGVVNTIADVKAQLFGFSFRRLEVR